MDVGSGHATLGSNTKTLENAGWRGVCIDPFPTGDWAGRSAKLYNDVVSSKSGEIVEFRNAGGLGGIDSHITSYRKDVEEHPLTKLATTTLEEVLDRANAPNHIHYISLDIEGAEYEVLRVFPFTKYTVGAFTIEHNFEEPRRSLIRKLLTSKGYSLAQECAVEDWYILRD
ncbi:MAG: FkbM family methyltransferase [Planctomycetales bacterium]|nr:FkbM family methyltransferase [Planctomycetales bacterium]